MRCWAATAPCSMRSILEFDQFRLHAAGLGRLLGLPVSTPDYAGVEAPDTLLGLDLDDCVCCDYGDLMFDALSAPGWLVSFTLQHAPAPAWGATRLTKRVRVA